MNIMLEDAKRLQQALIDYRRFFHQQPEVGMSLPKTVTFVKNELEKMGIEPQEICPSGLIATVGGKKTGKVFLLRADMDALPIEELTDDPFKSCNENMHACGHDFHTAMLLGAAQLLKARESEIEGTVKLMFQPGEETLEGAKAMREAGILGNPKVDAALMIHVFSGMPLSAGQFLLPAVGPSAAASDWFEIKVQGKGGHGAMPEMAVDPLNIASHIYLALQSINSREVPATEGVVVTVGQLFGGETSNVIPDSAIMKGTVRTFNEDVRSFTLARIKSIVEGTAKIFRGDAKALIRPGCPAFVNAKEVFDSAEKALTDVFGASEVIGFEQVVPGGKMMGSEDFAYIAEKVPSLMLALTAGDSRSGYGYPMHHPKVRFDESVLYKGATAYAAIAMYWLAQNKL